MKFSKGERLVYSHSQGSYDCVVLDTHPNTLEYLVEFGADIIPPQMIVNESGLTPTLAPCNLRTGSTQYFDINLADPKIDIDKRCPTCDTEWNDHLLLTGVWTGCDKCNKSKQEIIDKWRSGE